MVYLEAVQLWGFSFGSSNAGNTQPSSVKLGEPCGDNSFLFGSTTTTGALLKTAVATSSGLFGTTATASSGVTEK